MSEGSNALAQAAIHLAIPPKSNAVYMAYTEAAEAAAQEIDTIATLAAVQTIVRGPLPVLAAERR